MAITAAEVSKLRKATGAGMMDCKKALEEANGNFEEAVETIRKKGQAIANKRSEREASEGAVIAKVSSDGKTGALAVLNCETDFVAKNEDFVKLAHAITDLAIDNDAAEVEALKKLTLNGKTVEENVTEQMGVIGEKLDVPHVELIKAEKVIAYIHPGNKVASLVGFNKDLSDEQIGKDVAMQIAAMSPVAIDADDVPEDRKQKELEIGREQAKLEGKPENILDKIAQGKLQKFYKEFTLLNQQFIKDSKMNVKQYLQQADEDLKVTAIARYSLVS